MSPSRLRFAAFIIIAVGLVTFVALRNRNVQQVTHPVLNQDAELADIRMRFEANQDWINSRSFAVMHVATEPGFSAAKVTIDQLHELEDVDRVTAVIKKKSLPEIRSQVSQLLQNSDPSIRSFGIVWMFVLEGDRSKQATAKLLDDRPEPPGDDLAQVTFSLDRCVAAQALGKMRAKEYAPRLSELLKSKHHHDRIGAINGLQLMGAKEYSKQIAELLHVDDNNSDILMLGIPLIVIETLASWDAADCADQIASALKDEPIFSDEAQAACYALARFNSKSSTKVIAGKLKDRNCGAAAKALALLSSVEYSEEIAQPLTNVERDPASTERDRSIAAEDRSNALIALGILDARDYRSTIAAHLEDSEPSVRAYAAVSLLLLGDKEHSQEIKNAIHAEWDSPMFGFANDPASHFRSKIWLRARYASQSLIADREEQLTQRAVNAWNDLTLAQN